MSAAPRTVVLGGGIIGTATAYYLARAGHRVSVIERRSGVGLETSFANGGLVTPSMADPWSAPGVPGKLVKWIGREDAPLLLRLRAVPGMALWGLRFLANCRSSRWRANAEAVYPLALFSRDALDELVAETGIAHDRSTVGTVRLYRDEAALAGTAQWSRLYRDLGLPFRVLDRAGCLALEPALKGAGAPIAGGIHVADDRSGDAYKFTEGLARLAAGVDFRFGTTIRGFATEGDRIAAVETDRGRVEGDRFVLALGSYGPALMRALGLKIPICPVKGYSATLDVAGWNGGPRVPIIDDHRKTGIIPMGERLRLAGTVEFAGFDTEPNERRGGLLVEALKELFPDCPPAVPQYWSGLRPMTPDGRPIIGPTRWRNLYLNTGHGSLGWTLACGSARLVAAMLDGRKPEVDPRPFALDRF